MTRRVFVTGATGVIGRRVVTQLVDAGHQVTAVARSADKAATVRDAGATPIMVDLCDSAAMRAALVGHDAVAQLATHIPTGPSAALKTGWKTNDMLRGVAAPNIAAAAIDVGVTTFVQESITFPYVDGEDSWLDEDTERIYFWGNRCTAAAEDAAARFSASGGSGVVLRFGLFQATDSAHTKNFLAAARTGVFALVGDEDAYVSFIHIDDAATAVIAALDVPAGVYNVAEPDPVRRSDHRLAMAAAVGRKSLRTIPQVLERVGGQLVNSLARSHRISTQRLHDVSSWSPKIHCVDHWGDPA